MRLPWFAAVALGVAQAGPVLAADRGPSAAVPPPAGGSARGVPQAAAVLLTDEDLWRKHYTFVRPVFADGQTLKPGVQSGGQPRVTAGIYTLFQAPPPADPPVSLAPAGWTQVDFDDHLWLVTNGRDLRHGIRDSHLAQDIALDATNAYLRGSDPFFVPVGLISQRGRFSIADRRGVRRLTLWLTYRGGVVVFLNGREVARAHLPEGDLLSRTPASVYPPEAFFYRDSLQRGRPAPLNPTDRKSNQWSLRERARGPIDLPTDALRDGVNVLALELHRSAYPDECKRLEIPCATVGLGLLELCGEGAAGAFAEGGSSPPRLRVWTVEVTRTLFEPARCDLHEWRGPVWIVGARNGTFSGQVVVEAGGTPREGLSARLSELRQNDGGGVIPAACVRLRYGQPNPLWPAALDRIGQPIPHQWRRDAGAAGGMRFDCLLDEAPPSASAFAVWVSVSVPKDAPPGEYAAHLTVATRGTETVSVPVRLYVADWTLPDLEDGATLINIYQSPETLAEYYRVKPWSEAHWRLIDQSMRLMGEIGNIGLFIPLLAESQMGNSESTIAWVRQANGSHTYDFSVLDRYLETALKYHGRLRFISLNVWGYEAALRTWQGPRDYATFRGARVTVLDPWTGVKANVKLPQYGTPECEALWRLLLVALRERLKTKGLDHLILLGLCANQGPDVETAAMYRPLGAAGSRAVPIYSSSIHFGDLMPTEKPGGLARVLDCRRQDREAGYRAFKLKIGRGLKWVPRAEGLKRDIEVTRAVEHFGVNFGASMGGRGPLLPIPPWSPSRMGQLAVRERLRYCRILVDANDGYTVEEAIDYVKAVADCDLCWIEEPFEEDRDGLKRLREAMAKAGC